MCVMYFDLQIMSGQAKYTQFLLQLADLGCSLQLSQLRDSARALLNIMPADQFTGLLLASRSKLAFELNFHMTVVSISE